MDDTTRKGAGGPRTEAGRKNAIANLRQFQVASHGAYGVTPSDEAVVATRQELATKLEAEIGAALRPADRVSVELLAITLRRIDLVERHLDSRSMIGKDGSIKPAAELLTKLLTIARSYTFDLGMSPAGRAKLGLRDGPRSAVDAWAEAARLADADKEGKN